MADRSVVLQSAAYPPRRKTWLEFYFCRSPALVGTGIGFTFKLVQPQVLLVSDDGYFPFPFAVAVSLGGLVGRMLGALEIDVDDVEVMPTAPDLNSLRGPARVDPRPFTRRGARRHRTQAFGAMKIQLDVVHGLCLAEGWLEGGEARNQLRP